MLQKDKVVLRNVVIAVVAGSLGAVAIGTSCLGSRRLVAPDPTTSSTATPRANTAGSRRDNAGGVEPVGTTNITSTTIVVNPAAAPAATTPTDEAAQSPVPANPTTITQRPGAAPQVWVTEPPYAPPATAPVDSAPPPEPQAAPDPQVRAVPVPIFLPNPNLETPSSGNVPSNPGPGSPSQPPPPPPIPGTGAGSGNPYPQNLPNTLPQGRLPQPSIPTPAPAVPAPPR
ncbi:MAG: hypothetical protein U0270_15640 [Labilithrix sp.]